MGSERNPLTTRASVVFLALATGACGDPSNVPAANLVPDSAFIVAAGENGVAFVSMKSQFAQLAAGGIARGVVRSSGGSNSAFARIVDGGFDPVSIPAQAGDPLEIGLIDGTGSEVQTHAVRVPVARRPTVVRTIPPRGKKAVPLNSVIMIVFSEPVDSSVLSSSAIRLTLDNALVSGAYSFADSRQLVVHFVPSEPLAPLKEYTLSITLDVKDVSGSPLEEAIALTFTTEAAPPVLSGPVRVIIQASGVSADMDYTVQLGDSVREISLPQMAYFPTVPAGEYRLTVGGLAPHCSVADNPRTVLVTPPAETQLTVSVTCAATFGLKVNAVVTGADADTAVRLIIQRLGFEANSVIAGKPFETYGLLYGEYFLTLADVAANCRVIGDNPMRVIVPDGGVADATFKVECTAEGRIAYAEDSAPTASGDIGNIDIYVVRPSGLGRTRLTSHSAIDRDPSWSPDGSRIVFTTDRDGNDEIYVMNSDGSNPVRLTDDAAADNQPAWSPDGTRIAFVSDRGGNVDVYVMNVDGSGVARLTNDPAPDQQPSWSPDSKKLAFRSDRSGPGHGQIYAMNADGSALARLTIDGLEDTDPAWSPDGTRIVFTRVRFCLSEEQYDGIACQSVPMFVRSDGTGVTQLNAMTIWDERNRRPGGADFRGGAWSPDGNRIIFAVHHCGWDGDCHPGMGLWTTDIATGESSNSVSGIASRYMPDARKRFPSRPTWTK